ncbi:hypothetical protein QBC39DRAFT_382903 [Podospora conica]|nr:hypothetical protein QBC39DRAFT_382903 [Schizothecium conicum]
MKPSSFLRLSLLSSTAIFVSASSVTAPASQLPPSLDTPSFPDSTFRTITISRASTTTTATLSMLLPPSAPRPPLAGSTNRLDLRADEAPAPPAPGITPPPDAAAAITEGDDGWQTGIDANGKLFRFRQTTYYSCVTQKTASHCGWHRPILEVSGAAGDDGRRFWGFGAKAAAAVGAAAAVVLVG